MTAIYNETRPLLSIAVPTRNRVPYVISAIKNILSIADPRLELVIQDNSDSRDLEHWVTENINDSRLRYQFSETPLSFVGNFGAAIEVCRGEYICMIGDDDGVNPEIIQAAEWLKKEGIECLALKTTANYVWGDAGVPATFFTHVTGGVLTMSPFDCELTGSDIDQELKAFLNNGAINYLDFSLPKLYHGIVKRSCLEIVKEKTGHYFGGLSPDIYAAISVACVTKSIRISSYPLTISGVCKVSGSIIEGLLKKNSKKLEDALHLRNRGPYTWNDLVPRFYTVETIWADTVLAALNDMGRPDLVQYLNLPKLAACCINAHEGISKPVLQTLFEGLRKTGKSQVVGAIQFAWYLSKLKMRFVGSFMRRVWNRFLIMAGIKKIIRTDGLNDIEAASKVVTDYLNNRQVRFVDCIKS